ncbi:MAG: AlpA family phage regulatory protein [Hyphomonas sp.]|uniref:helix-turn-helix transcriptional regulator n=1 Tax=Hyphomonas sp. TaxID=87 RepID=UPI00300184A8
MPKPAIIQLTPNRLDASKHISPKPQRFLSLRDVLDRLTISRSLLYELIKDPVRPFPSPVHLGRRSVWIEGEVEGYMREVVEAERAAPPN